MVDQVPEQQRDLLDLLGDFGPNQNKDGGPDVISEIRLVLSGSGMVVPTIADIMASDEGKTAEIVAARQAPLRVTRGTPEEAEWRIQTDRFIELGFADELKYFDPEVYRLTIPQFFPKPKSYDGHYDKPLAVEVRIPLPRLHQLAGIKEYIDVSQITNRIRMRRKPYTIYIANNVETVTGTFDFAVAQLSQDGSLDTFIEIDMAYLRYLELFQPWLDGGNSRFGADNVPCLFVSSDRPRVYAYWSDDPHSDWRLLSRGKKIGT